MIDARWIRRLTGQAADEDSALLAALEDFSYPDWEAFLYALAWKTPDTSTIEQAFVCEPGSDLLPVVAATVEQLGRAALRNCGSAIEALVGRYGNQTDECITESLLVLLKLTIMIGRGPSAITLQTIVRDRAYVTEVREAAASALSDFDSPYDASFWEELDYRIETFAIPPCLSYYAVRDPARAIRFLSEFAEFCRAPERLYAATAAALWRFLKDEGSNGVRVALEGIAPAGDAIVRTVLQRSEFAEFGPDLTHRLLAEDQPRRIRVAARRGGPKRYHVSASPIWLVTGGLQSRMQFTAPDIPRRTSLESRFSITANDLNSSRFLHPHRERPLQHR